jgi:hypothetical protein
MMIRRRSAWAVAVLLTVLGLTFAAVAAAYTIPKPAGSAGGPPTAPKTTSTSKKPGATSTPAAKDTAAGATGLGTKLAALTNTELATQGSFTVTVTFPTGGTMLASASAPGVGTIASGFAGRANKGTEPLTMTFTAKGKAFLLAHPTTSETLTIKLVFTPNKGSTVSSSTVTVATLA